MFQLLCHCLMDIEHIAVIGSGQMGNGIAQVAACAGYQVTMVDIKQEFVNKGMETISRSLNKLFAKERMSQEDADLAISRIQTSTDNNSCENADLVVEAIPEIPELKYSTFSNLDSICKDSTILATNTSSISIDSIAASTSRPEKVIGMHFMNPVPIMKLVEVINGTDTSSEVTSAVLSAAQKMGKPPLMCND